MTNPITPNNPVTQSSSDPKDALKDQKTKPQTKNVDRVKGFILGNNGDKEPKVRSTGRESIDPSGESVKIREPKASLVQNLVSSIRQYIKARRSHSPKQIETSWPLRPGAKPEERLSKDQTGTRASLDYNLKVEKLIDAKAQLNHANRQLQTLEHNQLHPKLRPLPLQSDLPKEEGPLKALISNLEKRIQSEDQEKS